MTTPPHHARARALWARVVGAVSHPAAPWVLAAWVVAVRLLSLALVLQADEAGFTLVARSWDPQPDSLYGPYFVDRPPLVIALFGAGDALAGTHAVRALGAVTSGLAVLLAAPAGRLVAGAGSGGSWADDRPTRTAGGWSALVTAAALSTPLLDVASTKGEVLAVPFLLAAAVLGLLVVGVGPHPPSRPVTAALSLVAGFCAGVPLGLKQNLAGGLVLLAALGVAAVVSRRMSVRRFVVAALAALAGAALPIGAQVAWALGSGVRPGTLWETVYGFRGEAATVLAAQPSDAPLTRAGILVLAGLLAGLGLVVGGFVANARGEWARDPVVTSAIAALLAWDAVSLVLGGSYWRDYLFPLVPGAALATGLLARRTSRRGRYVRVTAVVAALSCVVSLGVWGARAVAARGTTQEWATGEAVGAAAQPGDTITVYGGRADVVLASGLDAPYPYLWSLPMRVLDPDLGQLRRLLTGPDRPTWVVLEVPLDAWTPGPGARVQTVLDRRYSPAGAGCDDVAVYVRDDVQRPALQPHCP
ncbi:hypothetical protein [Nocardioides sp. GY 10127]|uniref:hypothetical protein n=1 Tax=Nocardioides sp. GY 10127 TaxID=2569762 RepID=UPI0010A7B00D|nr:hypothetical protein [Nocardioides sp. GY 10127]TIC84348.1 hypothetical protein E8D37_06135 [Nocardioides sp. GY 10127]